MIGKVSSTAPEQTVNLVFLRETGDKTRTQNDRLLSLPNVRRTTSRRRRRHAPTKLPVDGQKEPLKPFGLTLIELTPALVATYKLEGEKGLLVKEINPASFIADVKTSNGTDALSEGDLIQRDQPRRKSLI